MQKDIINSESSIEIIYSYEDDVNNSKSPLLDNKAMVTPLPSAGVQPHPNVRINITDPDNINSSQRRPSRFRCRKIRMPYAINAFLAIIVVSIIILLELGYIPGTKTGFYCKDPLLSHPFRGDTISATTLLVSNLLVVPLIVLLSTDYLQKRSPWQICLTEIWYIYKEFLTGCGLVLLITEIMKALVGEHRPHFFDVCRPTTAENCTAGEYLDTYDCSTTTYSLHFLSDTSRSFPSGHSSLSVFVALFCSYMLQTRLTTIQTGQLFKVFSIAVCITWSLVCSLTRITDKRHHWWDVAAGILLGVACAFYTLYTIRGKMHPESIPRVAMSTTTLLDIKNKDAKSEII